MATEYFDIVVITPMEEELIEFLQMFPSLEDRSTENEFMHVVDSSISEIRMLVVQQRENGKSAASDAAGLVLEAYGVGTIICLGIAGGLSGDLRLGDVCYSGGIIDVYDNTRVLDCDGGGTDTELSPTHYSTPNDVTAALNFIRTQPDLRPKYLKWQEERSIAAHSFVPHHVPTRDGGTEQLGEPTTLGGVIVCGAVSKSENYNKKLRSIERKLLAIETESGGVFGQARSKSVNALTIRGISDYADMAKGKLESASKGGVRKLAASNAASFLRLQMQNDRFVSTLAKRRNGHQSELNLIQVKSMPDPLSIAMGQLAESIDDSLRKLSPEYKLQPKGYRLPLPRVKKSVVDDGMEEASIHSPIEVRDAMDLHDRILINLPRTYPDQSLAWVLADDLMTAEIDGKNVIPVVIDGEAVRGKQLGFRAASSIDLLATENLESVQIIFVVENLPLGSKHRLGLILEEIEKFPRAKYIFIARGDTNLISETKFQAESAAVLYELCPISFLEIAHFIQKNFGMTGTEAEVVALRLRDTFDRFNLDAHPTYFAGIPRETLAALLHANRRSELIQLAVDGFLTFLVAGDQQDVALSRSTRARFLRKLVVQMRVEKRSFDQAQLVSYTKEFADVHDFEINPIAFIQAFVDQGIMHFDGKKMQLSLPFIESYLLASELSFSENIAKSYFKLDDIYFDLVTFDLYAEIGASPMIVEMIVDSLETSSAAIAVAEGEEHILLTEAISPSNFRRPERAQKLRKRLRRAAEAVQEGTDNLNEKQRLLDVSERVREATGKQRKIRGYSENDEEPDAEIRPLSDASRHWAIATVLLGSGAEHLDASTKRGLSSVIIKAAARIVHHWSKLQHDIDFQELRDQLTTDRALDDLPGDQPLDEKRSFVSGILDLLEYAALADPVRRVLGYLCEQARHRVLATSVEKADSEGFVDKIIHGSWLADIDSARGKAPLTAAIRTLPLATFFRMTLATHYLTRVYWNHWHKQDRLALLNAAEEAIKPLEVSINRPELKRFIERGSVKSSKNETD